MIQKSIALLLFILSLPLLGMLFILIKIYSPGPFIFKQQRTGKNKSPFTIYKIRTMVEDAERMKKKLLTLNEADGPVFKIANDPRYTSIGKILSKTGLDELPQLINIIKGEMAFVGPRPLPVEEANTIPSQFHDRFSVLPGITSLWVIKGSHKLPFSEWMKLDSEYVKNRSFLKDITISMLTMLLILHALFSLFKRR